MQASRRPLSPHLQIYRLPLTAVLSIAHRITGFFLSLAAVALVVWLVAVAMGDPMHARVHTFFISMPGRVALIAWSAMLYFHLCNGIRHLFWDAGQGFGLRAANTTALLTLVVTAVLTALTWQVWGMSG